MEEPKYIPLHQKFTSELDMSDPAHRDEMNKRVFGRNYRKDADGKPIEQDATSDFAIRNGITQPHRLEAHLNALVLTVRMRGGSEGDQREALDKEAARIQKLDHEGKYAEVLKRARERHVASVSWQ